MIEHGSANGLECEYEPTESAADEAAFFMADWSWKPERSQC